MAAPATKRATYADLEAVPSHYVAEIIRGTLHVHPRPSPKHARAGSMLGGVLSGPFDRGIDGPGGWWILDEPELHLLQGEEVLVPDIAGWRVERMPELPETAYFSIPPDWVCEVLSPSTAAIDRVDKMPIYAEAGVDHAWLVDPILQTVEVFRREGSQRLLLRTFKGDRAIRAEPFEAIEIPLGALWGAPVRKG
ncbi:Uma2 family endonuclease [Pendulispora rubella]|uniref:Uma2 family endonuclease n=1 Tax=Pendulispora rubella TaxID=2741070 RepID=A0ABZ2LA12_9BACT